MLLNAKYMLYFDNSEGLEKREIKRWIRRIKKKIPTNFPFTFSGKTPIKRFQHFVCLVLFHFFTLKLSSQDSVIFVPAVFLRDSVSVLYLPVRRPCQYHSTLQYSLQEFSL